MQTCNILKITSYPITNDENIHRRQLFPQATEQWNKEIQSLNNT